MDDQTAQQGARANAYVCHVSCSEQHEPRQPQAWLIFDVGQRMRTWLRGLCLWNRKLHLEDEARICAALKASWRWALPMWIFPAVAATDWIANNPTERQLIMRAVVPFGIFAVLALFGTWRIDMGRKESGVIFYLIPFSVFLASTAAWAIVHDFYVR